MPEEGMMILSKVIKRYAVTVGDEKYIIPVTQEKKDVGDNLSDVGHGHEIYGGDADDYIGMETKTDDGEEAGKSEEIDADENNTVKEQSNQKNPADIVRESELIGEEKIAQAQRTADLIVNHALESARAELNNAVIQGYSDGFEEGKSEAMSVITPALDKIKRLTDAVTQMQEKMLEDFKDEMFNIISDISNKIIHREIDEKDEYLMTLFSDAIKNIRVENFVTVTVSESQVEFAVRNIEEFKSKVSNIDEFKIISDKNLGRGTMIVETSKTVADASFNVQAEKINSILENMKENFSVSIYSNNSNILNNLDDFDSSHSSVSYD